MHDGTAEKIAANETRTFLILRFQIIDRKPHRVSMRSHLNSFASSQLSGILYEKLKDPFARLIKTWLIHLKANINLFMADGLFTTVKRKRN